MHTDIIICFILPDSRPNNQWSQMPRYGHGGHGMGMSPAPNLPPHMASSPYQRGHRMSPTPMHKTGSYASPPKMVFKFLLISSPNWVILENAWFLTRWQCDDPFLFVKRCRRFTPIKFQKRKFRFLRTAWRRPHPTTSRDGDWLAQMLVCLHVLVKPFIAHHLCTWTKKKNLSIVSRIGIHHADSQTKITSVW